MIFEVRIQETGSWFELENRNELMSSEGFEYQHKRQELERERLRLRPRETNQLQLKRYL